MQTKRNQRHSSKVSLLLASSLLLIAAGWVKAQTQERPKPGPEHQKLAIWLGDWTYKGEVKDSPLGPGGKLSGKFTARPILGGFFVEFHGHETSPLGDFDWVEIEGYDPIRKRYTWTGFYSDGESAAGTYTLDGATISWVGTMTAAGKQYHIRGTHVFAPDFTSFVDKREISGDGKTWAVLAEGNYTKVKAASAAGANTQVR